MMGTTLGGLRAEGRGRRAPRWIVLPMAVIGAALLAGAGYATWSEMQFRRIAVETEGRVVRMLREFSSDSDGRRSATYRPVFTFTLPDGREVRAEGSVASNPPCCTVGEAVRVRYDPARPERAAMVGFMESWFLTVFLGGMGTAFLGFGVLGLRYASRRERALAASGGMPSIPVPLAGLRREGLPPSARWVVQARWTDPGSGAARLFESEPLPFDPVPQMRHMTTVPVCFDPSRPDGPYRMELGFLEPPGVDAAGTAGPVRRG